MRMLQRLRKTREAIQGNPDEIDVAKVSDLPRRDQAEENIYHEESTLTTGLLLYSKLSRCRSGKTSTDIRKVAGLAVASVVCFSVQSLLVFFTDIPVFTIWSSPQAACHILRLLTFLYYFIGEAIPSVVVLWVMKDVPARSTDSSGHLNFPSFNEGYESLEPDQALLEEWLVPEDDESLIVVPRSWSSEDAKFEVSLTL
ncbi:hypothetical protein O6H91_16G024100 [Diphasiastrum complanatum]|uniref:Uncharacterized protein n=1 Tax=Diphasiastrum complanatum TaxID=34168 RepID=A0ACC2BAP9_DIPCM|nr:hypothetical protein O6H91_16G024100 [Diphasiastrum complanatum]